jgi:hypothetical protein
MADMPVGGEDKGMTHHAFSFTRDLTRSPTTPCLHDTTTGGATGAGNETTEIKARIGIGIETETETVIRAAGAAAPAARDDQACATDPHCLTTYNRSTVLQIDVTMEEIRMRTGETGIPGTHAAAMSEVDETYLVGMEKRTGIGMRGTRRTERRVGLQSTRQRGLLSGVHGWIQSPGRQ